MKAVSKKDFNTGMSGAMDIFGKVDQRFISCGLESFVVQYITLQNKTVIGTVGIGPGKSEEYKYTYRLNTVFFHGL